MNKKRLRTLRRHPELIRQQTTGRRFNGPDFDSEVPWILSGAINPDYEKAQFEEVIFFNTTPYDMRRILK
jgi:hypothetical protein